ncbi:MAG: TonB family protein [Candidatus Zixiibacteriota bacterium]|nr:MAG: TonB family protein [candidate division Zixibacteria bacterium]
MSDCDKIEALIRENIEGTISNSDREFLEKHLSECAKCRGIQSTLTAIAESKKSDEKVISEIDAEAFETAVLQKIRAAESELRFKREDQGYMLRLYFSVGLAAAIVAFMVLSLGDLERYVMPVKIKTFKSALPEKEYDTVQIVLKPSKRDKPAATPATPAREQIADIDDKAMKIMPPPAVEQTSDTAEPIVTAMAEEKPAATPEKARAPAEQLDEDLAAADLEQEYDNEEAVLESRGKKATDRRIAAKFETVEGLAASNFSILSRPVTKSAPDSVVINSIYLSDESIPMASQQTRAFLPEVVVDSGIIQAVETPRSILVTVDKMPVPVKIIPPEYPVWARKNGISGVVWVKARVDENGNVETAEILSSSMPGYGFEEASLEAAKRCRYIPAEANGFKIGIWVIYPVNFIFKNNDSD